MIIIIFILIAIFIYWIIKNNLPSDEINWNPNLYEHWFELNKEKINIDSIYLIDNKFYRFFENNYFVLYLKKDKEWKNYTLPIYKKENLYNLIEKI